MRCHWQEDFPKNVWRLIRQDTGVEVDTRAMTAEDRQGALAIAPDDDSSDTPPPRTPRTRTKKSAAGKSTTQSANA